VPEVDPVPRDFARRIVDIWDSDGAEWLERLPSILADWSQRWSLTVDPPFEPLSYNYVAPALRADGTSVVLKLGVPRSDFVSELEALRLFDGRGIVRLLEADSEHGVMLLERLVPGSPLWSLSDDGQATRIAAQVMRQLWRPVPEEHSFPTVAKWATGMKRLRERFDGGCGPFPPILVETAETLFTELIESMEEPALLHGDLHHENILSAERQPWLALDPKGLVGEPAYEVGALLRNPRPQLLEEPDPGRTLDRRLDLLAEELGFDRARLLGWSLAQAVLSGWWSFDGHGHGWEFAISCAELLAALQ